MIGGDEYVTKPFSLEEMVARIRTVLRRTGQAEDESSVMAFEDLELDNDTREVTRAGAAIDLTATEYRLLRSLLLNPRRVLTRDSSSTSSTRWAGSWSLSLSSWPRCWEFPGSGLGGSRATAPVSA